jgi:hypothetical protein
MSTDVSAPKPVFQVADEAAVKQARATLDAHAVEMMAWHFHPSTGCPFWLEYAKSLTFNPITEVKNYDDLKKFPLFEDDELRGGPVRRWLPKGLADEVVSPLVRHANGPKTGRSSNFYVHGKGSLRGDEVEGRVDKMKAVRRWQLPDQAFPATEFRWRGPIRRPKRPNERLVRRVTRLKRNFRDRAVGLVQVPSRSLQP